MMDDLPGRARPDAAGAAAAAPAAWSGSVGASATARAARPGPARPGSITARTGRVERPLGAGGSRNPAEVNAVRAAAAASAPGLLETRCPEMSSDRNGITGEDGAGAAAARPDGIRVIRAGSKGKGCFLGVLGPAAAAPAEVVAAAGMPDAAAAAFTSALAVNGTRQGGPGTARCECQRWD